MKCNICLERNADETGSHITSAFLLTSQIGKRGQEKAYLITADPNQDYSINQGDNGIKEDNIICRICEQRLGVVEDIYSREVTQKIELKQFDTNFEKVKSLNNNYILSSKRISPIIFHLVIQSNIWRASISPLPIYSDFKLTEEMHERMRAYLNLFLPYKKDFTTSVAIKAWIQLIQETQDLFDFIPLAVIKAENIDNKDLTYIFFDNLARNPYHLRINECVILAFNDPMRWEDDFFELKNEFELETLINKGYSDPKIGIIPNALYFKVVDKLKGIVVDQRIDRMRRESIRELLQRGIPISKHIIDKMVADKIKKSQF